MKRTGSPIFILFIMSLTLALLFACDDNSVSSIDGDVFVGPRLTFGDTLFEFGFAPQNSTVSHTFWLYSTGTETVEIHRVLPG